MFVRGSAEERSRTGRVWWLWPVCGFVSRPHPRSPLHGFGHETLPVGYWPNGPEPSGPMRQVGPKIGSERFLKRLMFIYV